MEDWLISSIYIHALEEDDILKDDGTLITTALLYQAPISLIKYLLTKKVNISTATAAFFNTEKDINIDIFKLLLEHNVTLLKKSAVGNDIFISQCGEEPYLSIIAQYNKYIGVTDHKGDTLLHFAVIHDNVVAVKLLLEKGIDINTQNAYGNTPLHYAYAYGTSEIVDKLIEAGADQYVANHNQRIPIECKKFLR